MHARNSISRHLLHHQPWNMEVLEYYLYKIFSRIADSLADIFLPVFLFTQLNFSIVQISLFFIIMQVFFMIFVPFAPKVVAYLGVKHTMALYLPFRILFFYGLTFLTPGFAENFWFIVLLLGIRSIPKAFRNTAETYFISKNILRKGHYGSSLSKIRIVMIFASLIAPLVGGTVVYFFGFNALFYSAMVFLAISTIPLFLTPDRSFNINFTIKNVWQFTEKLPKNLMLAECGRVFPDCVLWVLWPIFLIIIVKTTLNLGLLITASAIVAMLFSYYMGKVIDTDKSRSVLNIFVRLSTGTFFLRSLFANPLLIAIADIVNKIFDPILMIAYQKYLYRYVNSSKDFVEMLTARDLLAEGTYTVGTIAIFLIFSVLGYFGIPETNLYVFLGVFLVFGLFMLLMEKIADVYPETN